MALFGKKKEPAPVAVTKNTDVSEEERKYPVVLELRNTPRQEIFELLYELQDIGELKDLDHFIQLSAKVEVDPENTSYVRVLASVKKKRTYHRVGYIPLDDDFLVKKGMALVKEKTHFWALNLRWNGIDGCKFYLFLNESKFSK